MIGKFNSNKLCIFLNYSSMCVYPIFKHRYLIQLTIIYYTDYMAYVQTVCKLL